MTAVSFGLNWLLKLLEFGQERTPKVQVCTWPVAVHLEPQPVAGGVKLAMPARPVASYVTTTSREVSAASGPDEVTCSSIAVASPLAGAAGTAKVAGTSSRSSSAACAGAEERARMAAASGAPMAAGRVMREFPTMIL